MSKVREDCGESLRPKDRAFRHLHVFSRSLRRTLRQAMREKGFAVADSCQCDAALHNIALDRPAAVFHHSVDRRPYAHLISSSACSGIQSSLAFSAEHRIHESSGFVPDRIPHRLLHISMSFGASGDTSGIRRYGFLCTPAVLSISGEWPSIRERQTCLPALTLSTHQNPH
jgi:hypothetical protein